MKYIISTFLFFSISSSISAQTFAPPGAKWQYDYIDDFACGYIQYKYTHDTLINGKMTQALLRTLYVYNYLVGGMDTIPTWYEYVYTDSNRVYNYEFGNFYMLYDFNAQVGDWWEVAAREYYYACDSTGKVQVDSVSTTVINGDTLKVLYTSQKDSSHWSFGGRIIERIGCTSYLFPHPYTYCGVTFHDEYGPLRCYQDSAFNVYETGAADSCNHIDVLSIEDNPGVAMNISVFPNPFGVSTTIVIKNSQFYHVGEKDLSLVVYDILGKQIPTDFSVRQKTDQQVEIELWRGEMRSGMYFYILSTGENIVYNGKLIVD